MNKIELILFLTMATLAGSSQQVAGTGKTGPNGSLIGYNAAGPNWLYVPVDTNGYILVDCATGCSGGGGATLPTNAVVYGTGPNSARAGVPGSDFLGPNLDNGLNAHGIATSSANQNSYTWFLTGDVWNGSAGVPVYYGTQVIANTGTNPNTIVSHSCSTISTGSCAEAYAYPVQLGGGGTTNTIAPAGDKTTTIANTTAVWNSMPGLIPQYFGAYGDAFSPPDGLSTTASSTTVGCPDGCFLPADVGKDVWVQGAGAGGAAFHATITGYTNNTTVTVSAPATATLSNVQGVYGHDDTTALRACFKYSSVNAVQCILKPAPAPVGQNGLVGYLVGAGSLQLTSNNFLEQSSGPTIVGNSQTQGTNIFCEFNGDCLNLASGPIQGSNVRDVDFRMDPTQPASRGIHLNPTVGTFGNGPFSQANFINVNVDSPALECLWLDGGGGPGYGFNLPNQYIIFNQFWCNGPNQSHPANLIKATGQDLQIIFLNGQVNGQAWNGTSAPNYPNPAISITEKTSGLGDAPVDVKFFGYTFEVLTQGLYIGNGTNSIHYDNSYVENVSTPFIVAQSVADTFNGVHIANSGNITSVYQFAGGTPPNSVGASVHDNIVYGGVTPAAFGVCSGANTIDFMNNNVASGVTTTTGCATTTYSTSSSSITIAEGVTASITATGGAIQTITAHRVAAGKTLTLYGPSGFQLATGGNIALGNYSSPLTIPSGGSVTLTLLDTGVTWLVTAGPTGVTGAGFLAANQTWTGANTWAFGSTQTFNGQTNFENNQFFSSSSGLNFTQFGPGSTPGSSYTNIYDDGNLHIDGTASGTNRAIFVKGSLSGYIQAWQPPSGTNVATVLLDGTYSTSGGVNAAAPVVAPIFDSNGSSPTYTLGSGVTSVGCASGHTCTQSRGELSIVGGTATTGTIATLNFASSLPGIPECWVDENPTVALPTNFAIGHGTPTTAGFTITAGVSVIGATVLVDYGCQL